MSFRALWKHWFMIYFALLFAGPALILANNFCEDCFAVYINLTDSPILGFIMVALARFKIFQAVLDYVTEYSEFSHDPRNDTIHAPQPGAQ